MKMTSAYANKLLKQLMEEKDYWTNKEKKSSTYTVAVGEEPVIPEYNYSEVSATIMELDEKICKIKHAINITNAQKLVPVGEKLMSVDSILIKMAQLNKRKHILDSMRKREPKTREETSSFGSRSMTPEYKYINYDLETVKRDYESISKEIMDMQMALDKYNQTEEFDVEI